MFGLGYQNPENWQALEEAVRRAWLRPGATVIEITVPETAGAQTLQHLLAQVSQA
ncbi:2-succinyl-5-enolpyruvyl-6-hydroxy-3-cyclohexene-1-carboxylate synthase [Cedecea neteri]|nr:2-succinyl-5-enolpyruvyl-6-hydroxy-3-cyclohexene-1-carboxylate synthase [Cedecea neteri]